MVTRFSKDRVLWRSMLGYLYNWLLEVETVHLNVKESQQNPFRKHENYTLKRLDFDQFKFDRDLFTPQLPLVEQTQKLKMTEPINDDQPHKKFDKAANMQLQQDASRFDQNANKLKRQLMNQQMKKTPDLKDAGVSITDTYATVPPQSNRESIRHHNQIIGNERKSIRTHFASIDQEKAKQSNLVQINNNMKQQLSQKTVQALGHQSDKDKEVLLQNESELDENDQLHAISKDQVVSRNSIDPRVVKLPTIQSREDSQRLKQVQQLFNFPTGVAYIPITESKTTRFASNQRVKRQYVPVRGMPKIIDLTRDMPIPKVAFQAESGDLLRTFIQKSQERAPSASASMSQTNGFQQNQAQQSFQETKQIQQVLLPSTQLFKDYEQNLNIYLQSNPYDPRTDKDYIQRDHELNLLAQVQIFQLKDLNPLQEMNGDQSQFRNRAANRIQGTNFYSTLDPNGRMVSRQSSKKRPNKVNTARNGLTPQQKQKRTQSPDAAEGEQIEDTLLLKIKQMEQTIRQMSLAATADKSFINYPVLQRGLDAEQFSQNEIDVIKKHMASIGISVDTKLLEKAILIPKDMDPQGRRYPKIIDTLMKQTPLRRQRHSTSHRSQRQGVTPNAYSSALYQKLLN